MDDHKAWLAGVFDRAAPTYDRIGEAYHSHFAERLIDLAAPAAMPTSLTSLVVAARCWSPRQGEGSLGSPGSTCRPR